MQQQEKEDRVIAAICAAPTALKAHGIGKGKQITSYPSMKNELVNEYKYLEDKVVTDGNNYFVIHLATGHIDYLEVAPMINI